MTPTRPSTSSPYACNATLNKLCWLAGEKLQKLLDDLGVSLYRRSNKLVGPCPVHGGRKHNLNMYPDGYEARGNWACRSAGCHRVFPRSIVGFARGVLSHDRYDWERKGDREERHRVAVDFVCESIGVAIEDVRADRGLAGRLAFARGVEALAGASFDRPALCTREQFHRMVDTPAAYFVARGFDPATLRAFEVGTVVHPRSREHGRVLFPVYDGDGRTIVGGVSRSPHEKCPGCNLWHAADSPCPSGNFRKVDYLRYRVVGDWREGGLLYNLGRARDHVARRRSVVVVEGAADVWRLHEAGVDNAVALLGSDLTDRQMIELETLLLSDVVALTDADEAGEAAAAAIAAKCRHIARVTRVSPSGTKDLADMTTDDVRRLVVPEIDRRSR